jgi:hypothetical protein
MPAGTPLIPFGDKSLNPETGLLIDWKRAIAALASGSTNAADVHLFYPGHQQPMVVKFETATEALAARTECDGSPAPAPPASQTVGDLPAGGVGAGSTATGSSAGTVAK